MGHQAISDTLGTEASALLAALGVIVAPIDSEIATASMAMVPTLLANSFFIRALFEFQFDDSI